MIRCSESPDVLSFDLRLRRFRCVEDRGIWWPPLVRSGPISVGDASRHRRYTHMFARAWGEEYGWLPGGGSWKRGVWA